MTPVLAAGTRLGRYEILSQLGSGGMGEVYLARDTELERMVSMDCVRGFAASLAESLRLSDATQPYLGVRLCLTSG